MEEYFSKLISNTLQTGLDPLYKKLDYVLQRLEMIEAKFDANIGEQTSMCYLEQESFAEEVKRPNNIHCKPNLELLRQNGFLEEGDSDFVRLRGKAKIKPQSPAVLRKGSLPGSPSCLSCEIKFNYDGRENSVDMSDNSDESCEAFHSCLTEIALDKREELVYVNEETKTICPKQSSVQEEMIVPVQFRKLGKAPPLKSKSLEQSINRSTTIFMDSVTIPKTNFHFEELDKHICPDKHLFALIKDGVENLLKKLESSMNMELIRSGSSFESLNVAYPFEFDAQFIVNDFCQVDGSSADYSKTHAFEKNQFGMVKVKSRKGIQISPEDVQEKLIKEIKAAKSNIKLQNGFTWYCEDNFFLTHAKGLILGLVYEQNQKKHGVLIDVIPSLYVPFKFVSNNYDLKPIINDTAQKQFTLVYYSKNSWRLSASAIEGNLLGDMEDAKKRGLRIVKYFLQTFAIDENHRFLPNKDGINNTNMSQQSFNLYGYGSLVPSYFLKNTFLKTVFEMSKEQQKENKDDMTTAIVFLLLANLKHSYSEKKSDSMRSSQHFLISNQFVRLMENASNKSKVLGIADAISDHIKRSNKKIAGEKYALLNYPLQTLPAV